MILLLISPRILSIKNSVNTKLFLKRLPFMLMGGGFFVLLYFGTYQVLSFIRGMELIGETLSEKFFSMIFFGLFGFLILSNIITGISSFYLSKDIPFLLSKPVRIKDILWLKTFEAVLNSSWMVIFFAPPLFIAYGVSYRVPFSFYASIVCCLVLFILIAAGLGISLSHILTSIFPAKRSRDMLFGLAIILFILIYFVLKSVIPRDPGTPEELINSFLRFRTDSPFLPGFWVTRTVFPLLRGTRTDLFYLMLLLSNSAFFVLLSSLTGRLFYLRNIEKLQPSSAVTGMSLIRALYPGRPFTLLYKDAKIFFRDTGQWSQLFIIGALLIIYINNFKSIPLEALSGISPFMKEIMLLVNMVMAGLVLTAVAARFVFPLVSLEGEAFWVIRTAPVEMYRFLWSKFAYGCIPVTLLITLLVLFANINIHVSGLLMWLSAGTALLLCISVSGLGTGLGALYPRFRYENIASVSVSLGSMAFMVIAFCLVLLTLSLEVWIYYLWRIKAAGQVADIMQIILCAAFILAINFTAFYLPMKAGERKLRELSGDSV